MNLSEQVRALETRLEVWAADGYTYLGIGDTDGIGCRNETIKLQDARIAALEARCREQLEALRDCYARWQWFLQPETPEPPVFDMERIAKLLTAPETACEHHWMPATQDGSLAIIGRGCSKCGAWETSEANRRG